MKSRLALAISGLLLSPLVIGFATLVAPRLRVSPGTADFVAFAGATLTSLSALTLLSRGELPRWTRIAVGLVAVALVGLVALLQIRSPAAVILIAACLVSFAHVLGDLIGFHIEHPGHLLPASVVASIADLTSVLHPSGPSHKVIASERALAVLAVSFPILGTGDSAPTIGVGDLLFIALLLAAARRHQLSWLWMATLCAVGIAAAGAASYFLYTAIPALPAISLAVVSGVSSARKVRPRDRRVAWLFVLGAAVVAGTLVALRFLPNSTQGH